MFKKTTSIGLLLLLMGMSACSQGQKNNLAIKINEYVNYQEMIDAESQYLEKYRDEEKYVFPLDTSNMEIDYIKYFIGGICYCPLDNKDKPEHCNEEIKCDNLRNRELFVEYKLCDGNIITIIYKNLSLNKTDTFNWIDSNGGNCYRYEPNVNNELSYILEDSNENHLCGMKMLTKDDMLKSLFFDIITSSIS